MTPQSSIHFIPLMSTNTTNASQVLQAQQHQRKTHLQLALLTRLSWRRLLHRPLIKGANQTRLQRCLKRLVQIQTQKSKHDQAHGSGVGSFSHRAILNTQQYCIIYSKETLETGWSLRSGLYKWTEVYEVLTQISSSWSTE